jgi:hypothetical protein
MTKKKRDKEEQFKLPEKETVAAPPEARAMLYYKDDKGSPVYINPFQIFSVRPCKKGKRILAAIVGANKRPILVTQQASLVALDVGAALNEKQKHTT